MENPGPSLVQCLSSPLAHFKPGTPFPRRFPWLIVFLIAVGPVLFSVPLTIWYSFTMPPLERYYYDAYFNSTALKNSPSATTDVQWIFKTAPGRTEELAGPADIVSGSSADQERLAVPMKLSSAARDAGWKSLEQGSKERVNAAELQRYLQASFYDGEGFWRLLLQPVLWGVALILALLALRIWFASVPRPASCPIGAGRCRLPKDREHGAQPAPGVFAGKDRPLC
jgi:hypothetical protein